MKCPKCGKRAARWRILTNDVICYECQEITNATEFEEYKKREKANG